MKILKLKIQNINSIYGSWTIDFQKPEYTENGLFLLSGKTGSGKTTLFDAVCLALFGKTPRVKEFNKTKNDLISVGAGECSADLLFEAQGKQYRCTWSQNRARNNPAGALQETKRELIDAADGTILESKKDHFNDKIENIIGMKFEQFTKTMMLPQGDFSTFLKANEKDRAELFEHIAGGEIYRTISIKVYERQREESKNLDTLKEDMRRWEEYLLTDEQVQQLKEEQTSLSQEKDELAGRMAVSENEREWLKKLAQWSDQEKVLKEEVRQRESDWNQAAPKRKQRDRAQKAEKLNGLYSGYASMQGNLNDLQTTCSEADAKLPQLIQAAGASQKTFTEAEANVETAKQERKNQQPLLERVSALDIQISENEKHQKQEQEQIDNLRTETAELISQVQSQNALLDSVNQEILAIQTDQQNHPEEGRLLSEFSGIQSKLEQIQREKEAIDSHKIHQQNCRDALNKAKETLTACQLDSAEKEKAFQENTGLLEKMEAEVQDILEGRTLQDYQNDWENLQKISNLHDVIQSLAEHRSQLEDDKPCPLCGSTHHPYALGNIPSADEDKQKLNQVKERIRLIEKTEKSLKKAEKERTCVENERTQSRHQQELAQQSLDQCQKDDDQAAGVMERLVQLYQTGCQAVNQILSPFGVSLPQDDTASIIQNLKAKQKARQESEELLTAKITEKQNIDKAVESLSVQIREKEKQTEEGRNWLEQSTAAIEALQKERVELFGDKDLQAEKERLNTAVEAAETALDKARRQKDEDQKNLDHLKQDRTNALLQIERIKPQFLEAEQSLREKIQESGFTGLEDFIRSRIENQTLLALEEELGKLEKLFNDAYARLTQKNAELQEEQKKNLTTKKLEEVENSLAEMKQRQDVVIFRNAEITHQFKQYEKYRQKLKEINTKYKAQEKICRRWKRLSDLIGSANGDKYAKYVQNLTFAHIAALANQHLHKIMDRYELIPAADNDKKLELLVCDHYMADERRSVRNISGGEQFVVSLALALGISQMASRNVRVDSLFLDEGFGTLDKEMLHNAVEALVSLRQSSGKMIGIISHVEELKEQIPTRIEIESSRNGRSTIKGPGVTGNVSKLTDSAR